MRNTIGGLVLPTGALLCASAAALIRASTDWARLPETSVIILENMMTLTARTVFHIVIKAWKLFLECIAFTSEVQGISAMFAIYATAQ